ncbi:MAG TPA: helix-turn-helix domain-containing protein, partial [Chitinolyticbacter sp.]|nr:helix-turn-helix domain-containing protein [Chitinolyticbacter sp.]
GAGGPLQDYLDRVERNAIADALEKTNGNRTQAAKHLGVTFRSLRYRMDRLGIAGKD